MHRLLHLTPTKLRGVLQSYSRCLDRLEAGCEKEEQIVAVSREGLVPDPAKREPSSVPHSGAIPRMWGLTLSPKPEHRGTSQWNGGTVGRRTSARNSMWELRV